MLTVWGISIRNHFTRSFYSCDSALQYNSDNVSCPTLLWHNESTNITRPYTVAWLGFFDPHAELTDGPVISTRCLAFYKIVTNRLGIWNNAVYVNLVSCFNLSWRCLNLPECWVAFEHQKNILKRVQIMKLLYIQLSPVSCYFLTLRPIYPMQHPFQNNLSLCSSLNMVKFHTHTK